MKLDSIAEWQKFRDALIEVLTRTQIADFEAVWSVGYDKTQFNKTLLQKVAAACQYQFKSEFLRCDFAFLNSDRIPVVFIESENIHTSAFQEIDKLCAVSSPVKVLFLSCEWADSERQSFLPGWIKRMKSHHDFYGHDCVYMVVVGEWGRGKPCDDILRYYLESFDSQGSLIEPPKEITPGK